MKKPFPFKPIKVDSEDTKRHLFKRVKLKKRRMHENALGGPNNRRYIDQDNALRKFVVWS